MGISKSTQSNLIVVPDEYSRESRIFELARDLEVGDHLSLPSARDSEIDHWCLHFTELLLSESIEKNEEFAELAPLRAIALVMALDAVINRLPDTEGPAEPCGLRERLEYMRGKAMPLAQPRLRRIIESDATESSRSTALRMLFYLGIDPAVLEHATEVDLSQELLEEPELAALSKLPKLKRLDVSGTVLSSKSLSIVSRNHSLTWLSAAHTGVSDLAPLVELKQLKYLDLAYTFVSDRDLLHLSSLPKLRELTLRGSQATESAKRMLPGCDVTI